MPPGTRLCWEVVYKYQLKVLGSRDLLGTELTEVSSVLEFKVKSRAHFPPLPPLEGISSHALLLGTEAMALEIM